MLLLTPYVLTQVVIIISQRGRGSILIMTIAISTVALT